MFSLENFYYILHMNLVQPLQIQSYYFQPFGSVNPNDLVRSSSFDKHGAWGSDRVHEIFFYDQEPMIDTNFPTWARASSIKHIVLIGNSEKSSYKKELLKESSFYDWYYFFHGFAALSWYYDYKYVSKHNYNFDKAFINLNRLTTEDRSYRLYLVSKMIEKDITKHGYVSLKLDDEYQPHWKTELINPSSKLTKQEKITIYKNLKDINGSLVVDQDAPRGDLSSHAGPNELKLNQSALWHVVSETVFYHDKLHLTEKIFKPIVSHRPFILVAATGNLAYLKSYGFKTFDKWIDESYDSELDNTKRIDMIVEQVEKISALSRTELKEMYEDMKDILDYNFNHFYGAFREIITDELLENFKNCFSQWNNGRIDGRNVDLNLIDFTEVRKTLLA